ncbi:MAG: ATP-binding protein [Desulfuromonadales bacterium]
MTNSDIASEAIQRNCWNCTEINRDLAKQWTDFECLDVLFDCASAPLIVWDADYIVTRFNRAFGKLTGLTSDQIIGYSLTKLFFYDQIESSLDLISKTYSGERWVSVEIPIQHLDGTVRILLWNSATIFEADGTSPKATIAQGVDITERKLSEDALKENEEKYRAMVESIDGCMYICSQDYRIEFMNDNLIRRTGRDATGEDCYKALHNLDAVCSWCVNKEVFAGKSVHWEIQSPKDGRWYDVNNSPIRKADGTISKQAIITDITDRKQLEVLQFQAREAAESANRAKSVFLSSMSHEIRTPLNAMMGNLTLLTTTTLTDEQHKCIRNCTSASQMLLQVINDILDFSKIEAGMMELVKESFSPCGMLYRLVDIFAFNANEKKLKLNLEISGHLPEFIIGDRHRINQIVSNLLSNALKFTEHGEVTVSASIMLSNDGTMRFVVSVIDSGIGIPPEQQSLIFSSFTQLEDFNTRRNIGSGLGLSISKKLVEIMAGEIVLSSTPGEGSIFTVTIPVIPCEAPKVKPEPRKIIRRTTRKNLLADDEAMGREVTTTLLERNGYTVKAVGDGSAVLQALQHETFDILLSDISMPDMDGTQVARIIRSGERRGINPQIPIIAMTAHAFPQDRERFLACGINDHIAKPIDFEALMSLIEGTCLPPSP